MAGETILVVEDTELLRRMYADKLVQDGYTVLSAADGIEALALLRTHSVDLILLDLVMPRMSGLEVLDTVHRDPRTANLPVIVLSNLGQESDVEKGLEMGAADYLVKNEARPADVSAKIGAHFSGSGKSVATGEAPADACKLGSYSVFLRDREGDADELVACANLPRRFWCPACEVELALDLVSQPSRPGWFDAHFQCPKCGRRF